MNNKFDQLLEKTQDSYPRPPDLLISILCQCSEFYVDLSRRHPVRISARKHGQHALTLFEFAFSEPTPSSIEELAFFTLSGVSFPRAHINLFAAVVMGVVTNLNCELTRQKSPYFKRDDLDFVGLFNKNGPSITEDPFIRAFMRCSLDRDIIVPYTPAAGSATAQKKSTPTPSTPYTDTRTSRKSSASSKHIAFPSFEQVDSSDEDEKDDQRKDEEEEQKRGKSIGKGKGKGKGEERLAQEDKNGNGIDAGPRPPHPPLTPCRAKLMRCPRRLDMPPGHQSKDPYTVGLVDMDLRNASDRSSFLVPSPILEDTKFKEKLREVQRTKFTDEGPRRIKTLPCGAFGDIYLALFMDKLAIAKSIQFASLDELHANLELEILSAVQEVVGMVRLKAHRIYDQVEGVSLTLIMSFSGYKTLGDLVYRERPVDPQEGKKDDTERCYILCQITWLLAALIDRFGVVHRDIKPENFILCENPLNRHSVLVKMIDFGNSRYIPKQGGKMTTPLKGTYSYISPEAYEGRPYDEKSESFSLGVTIFEVMSRRRVFNHVKDRKEVANMHAQGMRDEFDANFPRGIKTIVQLLWNHDETRRITIVESLPMLKRELTDFIIVEQGISLV
eukprot:TRINITY_DN15569_c1_g1_i3.p1 TRINITY_DN15569_c1_g1~~TRINITY_DN15569_c1_g1_i3.p1  ORF type:complete len:615 (-),score=88.22 TRINITY_DN15569_c1_g1_i3:247-2091(-)